MSVYLVATRHGTSAKLSMLSKAQHNMRPRAHGRKEPATANSPYCLEQRLILHTLILRARGRAITGAVENPHNGGRGKKTLSERLLFR
jgi:hypothetical protein